jgi:cytochrome bd-type quinol oxidase subunit 2
MKAIALNLLLLATVIVVAKALWHMFGMIRGVRSSSEWWVSLIPFIGFALPGALDAQGQEHRFKFVVSAFVAALLVVGGLLVHHFVDA